MKLAIVLLRDDPTEFEEKRFNTRVTYSADMIVGLHPSDANKFVIDKAVSGLVGKKIDVVTLGLLARDVLDRAERKELAAAVEVPLTPGVIPPWFREGVPLEFRTGMITDPGHYRWKPWYEGYVRVQRRKRHLHRGGKFVGKAGDPMIFTLYRTKHSFFGRFTPDKLSDDERPEGFLTFKKGFTSLWQVRPVKS